MDVELDPSFEYRELEQLTCEAAEIPVVWNTQLGHHWLTPELRGDDSSLRLKHGLTAENRIWFSPWTNNDDAFRIAGLLSIDVNTGFGFANATWVDTDLSESYAVTVHFSNWEGNDWEEKYAAMRQAIVRVAVKAYEKLQRSLIHRDEDEE